MATNQARYEFRIWAKDLSRVKNQLEHLAAPGVPNISVEIYLISSATDKCNAKIRSGLMDIKILINHEKSLEQWQPMLKAAFPLDSRVITTQIFPALELEPPRLARSEYQLDDFLNEIIRADNRITLVNISKERCLFKLNACQAEFAAVAVNTASRHTAAVESVDPEAVIQLTSQLGIAGAVNTSYVREIKSLLANSEA
jgi:hypothetical protein